ncbi:MAG: nucleoside deaminase [Gammaproteobacteria bacterium]|nr:nucleoside deaminase [Gammaproteobacteria bacterium]
MQEAIAQAKLGIENNEGGPFGAVVVKDGEIIGRGHNCVPSTNDPTAHAEVTAIRDACRHLDTFNLEGCTIYTSCEPCPMCLTAIYWARIEKIFFGANQHDAAEIGFDDRFFYEQLNKPLGDRKISEEQIMQSEAKAVLAEWFSKEDKIVY